MKFVLIDACLLTDFHELGLIAKLFDLDIHIVASSDLIADLPYDLQRGLKIPPSSLKLTIEELKENDYSALYSNDFPSCFSHKDKTGLRLARLHGLPFVTSDPQLWKFRGVQGIEKCGFLWLLEQLVDQGIVEKKDACEKLTQWQKMAAFRMDVGSLTKKVKEFIAKCSGSIQ